eukprot:comp19929_c0_seq1/m.24206 comp19929_c0_seq1/g.24206  ORF comp19929_c0_seq1/g.24206 comp19929_c0_seq1/m.24206 type:complete len:521 (-) comp19929_c0_seq1:161-1723(-)
MHLSSWAVSRKGNGGQGDRNLGPSPINARGIVHTRDTIRYISFPLSTSSTCLGNGSTPLYAGRAVGPTSRSTQEHVRFSRTHSHPHPTTEHFSASSPLPSSDTPGPVKKPQLHSASFPSGIVTPSKDAQQVPAYVRSRSAELSYGAIPYKAQNARPGPTGNWADHLSLNGHPRMVLLPLSSVPVATLEEMAVTDNLLHAVVRYVRAVWDRSEQYRTDFLFTYVVKLVEHLETDVFVMLSGIVYLERLREKFPDAGHSSDAKRLLTMGLMTAAKFHRDRPYNNKAWASVSKMPAATLNNMEEQFLDAISYRLNVTEADLANVLSVVEKLYGHPVNLNFADIKGDEFWTPPQAVKTATSSMPAHVHAKPNEGYMMHHGQESISDQRRELTKNLASPPKTSLVVGEQAAKTVLDVSKGANDKFTSGAGISREAHVFRGTDAADDSSSSPSPHYSSQESGCEDEHGLIVALSETRLAQATWNAPGGLGGKRNKPPRLALAATGATNGKGGFGISSAKATVTQNV